MARLNVYVPDELADQAKAAGLNISRITQESLRSALSLQDTNRWLDSIARRTTASVTHQQVLEAVDEAKREFEG